MKVFVKDTKELRGEKSQGFQHAGRDPYGMTEKKRQETRAKAKVKSKKWV